MKTEINFNAKRNIKAQLIAATVFVCAVASLTAIGLGTSRHAGTQSAEMAVKMDPVVVSAPRMAIGKMDAIIVTAPRLVNDTLLAHAHRTKTVMPL